MDMTAIIRYAKRLNSALAVEECRDIASEAIANCSVEAVKAMGGVSEYYDTVITVFVMSINRSLCFAKDFDKSSSDFYDLVDENSSRTEKIYREFVSNLAGRIDIVDSNIFCAYLEKLIKYIFMSYNDHLAPANIDDSCWDQWNREDDLRDYMMNLIRPNEFTNLNEFTKKYSIQVPYMYAFVNEFKNMLGYRSAYYTDESERSPENDGRYVNTMVIGIKEYLNTFRDSRLLSIMNVTEYSSSLPDPDWNDAFVEGVFSFGPEMIDFDMLLPHLEYTNEMDSHNYHSISEYDDKRMNITQEWYCSLPLVPSVFSETVRSKKHAAFFLLAFQQEYKLTVSNNELEKEKRIAEEAVKQKNSIMAEFAHTYGNMSAETLGTIADKLLKSGDAEIRKLGRQTMMECSIKQDLTSAIQMLRLKFNNNRQELCNLVRSGITFEPGNSCETIGSIVSEAMQRVLLRIFYDRSDEEKLTKGRRNVCRALGINSLDEVIDDFEEDILHNGDSITEWLDCKGVHVKLTIDGDFDKLCFVKNSKSAFFFKDIISESFFNMIKYAKLSEPLYMTFSSDENCYSISFKNIAAKYADGYDGKGLESKQEIIRMLNCDTDDKKAHSDINWKREGEEFKVQVVLGKDFLEGRA